MPKSSWLLILVAGLALAACQTGAAVADSGAAARPGQPCGGAAGRTCGAGLYCRSKTASPSAQRGVCVERPQMCNMLFQPVCGVDGKTYPNGCHAAQAGVNVAKTGACTT